MQRDIQHERSRTLSRVQVEAQSSCLVISTFYKLLNKALKEYDGSEGWVMWRHNFMLRAKA